MLTLKTAIEKTLVKWQKRVETGQVVQMGCALCTYSWQERRNPIVDSICLYCPYYKVTGMYCRDERSIYTRWNRAYNTDRAKEVASYAVVVLKDMLEMLKDGTLK